MKRINLKSTTLIALVALYFTVVLNYAFYHKVLSIHPFEGKPQDYFLFTVPFFVFFTLNAAFQLIALPILHKVIIPLLLIISAAVAYNSVYFDVYFNINMLDNVLQTTVAESSRMMTWQYITWIIAFGVIPALFYIWVKVDYHPTFKEILFRLGAIAISGIVILGIGKGFYKDYSFFARNNKTIDQLIVPANFIKAGIRKVKHLENANRVHTKIDLEAKQEKPDDFRHVTIMVVGETTRAENWGLNGYKRQTTPNLAKRGTDIINFNHVTSCGTATAISVPCMFSNENKSNYNGTEAKYTDNILDILQRAGIYVQWQENDGGCKGVCKRVPHQDVTELNLAKYCKDGECRDNILLEDLDKIINSTKKDTLIVLHTIGSHGPTYYERYSDQYRKFTPTCDTNEVQDCSNKELVNTYDNTILYIDQFLDKVISKLDHRDNLESAVLYVSDHGESLGEDGVYLHGAPYSIAPKEQTHVPMILWLSKTWKKNEGVDFTCLRHNAKTKNYSQDDVFSTLMSLMDMDLSESVYNKGEDILAPCRKPE